MHANGWKVAFTYRQAAICVNKNINAFIYEERVENACVGIESTHVKYSYTYNNSKYVHIKGTETKQRFYVNDAKYLSEYSIF